MTTVQQTQSMKSAALALAGRGWHVFPITVRDKDPMGGTSGHLDATTDPEVIERMWARAALANVGIHCARSGLYVIDVDMNPWKEKQGGRTWAALVGEHGHVETYTVRTWSGGLHFYYRMPEGMNLTNTTGKGGSSGRGLGVDIDTRGNGYVVAPPSIVNESYNGIPHQGQYVVEKDLPVADLPQWIIEMVREQERAPRSAGPIAADEAVLERVRTLADELEQAPDGEGNHTANRLAYLAGQYAGADQIDADEVIGLFVEAVSGWSWRSGADERSMHATITRAVEQGMKSPRAWERPVAAPRMPRGVAETREVAAAVLEAQTPTESLSDEPPADPEKEAQRDLSDWSTDLGQAHHLADRLRPNVMHADGVGWHCWDGTRWAPVSKDFVANMATRFYRRQFRAMLEKYSSTLDDRYNDLAKAYKSFMGMSRLGNILKMLSVIDGVFADPKTLDSHPELLNTPSGVVDLRTGVQAPHDPALLMTKITNGRYRPGFRHADWTKALQALPVEQQDYMQIRMGQAATGHNSHDVVFMIGVGANGKSAYSSEGVFPALGDYAHLAQPGLISKGQGAGGSATPDRASLRGVRFALIEELPESHALSVEEIKRIADTGIITARMLNANPITFGASHSLFVTSNSEPAVAEVDHGTWRRLLLVNFPYKFVEKPQAPTDRVGDPTLKRRIREGKSAQHDAIVTWLVEGAMRYFADPMLVEIERRPVDVQQAIVGWQMKADRIMAYFTDHLEADSDAMVTKADLYWDFTTFLAGQGHAKWSQETFMGRFRTHAMVTAAGATEAQVRSLAGLSRPPNVETSFNGAPKLASINRVIRGLKFRQDS